MRKIAILLIVLLCILFSGCDNRESTKGIDLPFEETDILQIELFHYDSVLADAEKRVITDADTIHYIHYSFTNDLIFETRTVESKASADVTSFRFYMTDGTTYELIYEGYSVKEGMLYSPTDGFSYFTPADIGWYWGQLTSEIEAVPAEADEVPVIYRAVAD